MLLIVLAPLSLITLFVNGEETSLPVLDFSYGPGSDTDTHASLDLEAFGDWPLSFTICSSVMVKAWTNGPDTSMHIFKLKDRNEDDLISLIFHVDWVSDFKIGIQKQRFKASKTLPWIFPLDWFHTCISVEQSSGSIILVVDGHLLLRKKDV